MAATNAAEILARTHIQVGREDSNVSNVRVKSEIAILALLGFTKMSTYPNGMQTTPSENTLYIEADGKATLDLRWYEKGKKTWFFYDKVDRAAAMRLKRKGDIEKRYPYAQHSPQYKLSQKGHERLMRALPRL